MVSGSSFQNKLHALGNYCNCFRLIASRLEVFFSQGTVRIINICPTRCCLGKWFRSAGDFVLVKPSYPPRNRGNIILFVGKQQSKTKHIADIALSWQDLWDSLFFQSVQVYIQEIPGCVASKRLPSGRSRRFLRRFLRRQERFRQLLVVGHLSSGH